jgi:hypothetical protein
LRKQDQDHAEGDGNEHRCDDGEQSGTIGWHWETDHALRHLVGPLPETDRSGDCRIRRVRPSVKGDHPIVGVPTAS